MPNHDKQSRDRPAVDRLFEAQGGLATRAQLLDLGVAPSTIRYRERPGGPWSTVLKGVCASNRRALVGLGRVRAALLFAGPGAVVTGFAALRAHGVCSARAADPRVKILIPHGRRRSCCGYVVIARSRRVPTAVEMIEGCAIAPIARAAVDACLDIKDKELVREVVTELVCTGRCTTAELCAELELSQPKGTARMRAVLAELAVGIRNSAEAHCHERLAHSSAPKPLWNRRIVEQATGRIATLPGAFWPDRGVALEVDPPGYRLSPAAANRATARRRWMAAVLRLNVTHVTPSQVRESWEEVWADLRSMLDRPATYALPPGYVLA